MIIFSLHLINTFNRYRDLNILQDILNKFLAIMNVVIDTNGKVAFLSFGIVY